MPASLRFTVAVIHRNGAERLRETLRSIAQSTDPGCDEIIVVDNASTDDSLDAVLADYPQVRVIRNDCNGGYARACNQAMRTGQGEFFLLCNNDLSLPMDALVNFAEDFRRFPRAGLIGAQLLGANGAPVRSSGPASTFLTELGFKPKHRNAFDRADARVVDTVVGACMAVRRVAVEQAGPLDEDFFFYYEEAEWCVRLARQGWDVMLDPSVLVTHYGGGSTRAHHHGARVEFFRSRLLYWQKTMAMQFVLILWLWHLPKMILDVAFYLAATALTFGLSAKPREKLFDRMIVLAWLLVGRPDHWGLPDKCPCAMPTQVPENQQ